MNLLSKWLHRKEEDDEKKLAEAVHLVFSSEMGNKVFTWMLSRYYFSVCDSNKPQDLAAHNAARALIQDLLNLYDLAVNPETKKPTEVET